MRRCRCHEHLQGVDIPASDYQIGATVPVEVGGRDAARSRRRGDVDANEAARGLAAKNGNRVGIGIGDSKVGNTVAIEVRGCQVERADADGDVVGGNEAARRTALVDQDRDRVAAGFRLREIQPAIAVEIRGDEHGRLDTRQRPAV